MALFQAEVRDALIPYEIAAPRFFYRNAGSTRHQGLEVGADLSVVPGVSLGAAWTYSDYRFRSTRSPTRPAPMCWTDGRSPGIPDNWLHLTLRAQPAAFAGAWAEVRADLFVRIPGERRREHAHVTVVVDEHTRRMGR